MSFPLVLLRGHISPETAYVVESYPYGSLRCKIRYWLESPDKGAGKGQTRFVYQTTNPKTGNVVWNKPKPGTYSLLAVMYQDSRNGYIHCMSLHYPGPDNWATFFAYGLYQQMNEEEKKQTDKLIEASKRLNPTCWKEWNENVEKVKAAVEKFGLDNPELSTLAEFNTRSVNYIYELTVQHIVNYMKAEQGNYTIPPLS